MPEPCRICAQATVPHGRNRFFTGRMVAYFRCPDCGFVQTETPDWLEAAYRSPLAAVDIGFFRRALAFSFPAANLAMLWLNPRGRHLDYGAGHGLFVRALRDIGLDFWGCDRYAACQLCQPWVVPFAEVGRQRFELATAVEVAEHLPEPLPVFDLLAGCSRALFFSTTLLPEPAPAPERWEYYGPDHGQHVSFYTRRSLEIIARRCGRRLSTNGKDLHLLAPRRIPAPLFKLLTSRFASPAITVALRPLCGIRSLTGPDVAWLRARAAEPLAAQPPPHLPPP